MFASQWSQPQLMKLAEATLGEGAVWSSQIKNWSTGALRDASPKLMLAVGQLNMAIAAANDLSVELPPHAPRCPQTLHDLYADKHWLKDADGQPLGPVEVFLAITGQIDLKMDDRSDELLDQLNENLSSICRTVGKYLRIKVAQQGIDVFEEIPQNNEPVNMLLWGKEVPASAFVTDLDLFARRAGVSADQFWTEALLPAIQHAGIN